MCTPISERVNPVTPPHRRVPRHVIKMPAFTACVEFRGMRMGTTRDEHLRLASGLRTNRGAARASATEASSGCLHTTTGVIARGSHTPPASHVRSAPLQWNRSGSDNAFHVKHPATARLREHRGAAWQCWQNPAIPMRITTVPERGDRRYEGTHLQNTRMAHPQGVVPRIVCLRCSQREAWPGLWARTPNPTALRAVSFRQNANVATARTGAQPSPPTWRAHP